MEFAPPGLAVRARAPGARMGALAFLLALALVGCGAPPTPEEEVRAVLGALEEAAERGDVSAFAGLVSAAYTDPYGHDRERLRAFVAYHVMQSGRGREVIVRVRDVSFTDAARAVVALSVGFVGARGAAAPSAEVYAVDMDLVREPQGWRVSFAQWRAAPATDLL